jgi:hypothetical protein
MKKRLNFLSIIMLVLIVIEFVRLSWETKGAIHFFRHNIETCFSGGSADWPLFWIVIISFALVILTWYLTLFKGLMAFVRFMLNVNKDLIFVKENVPLLRKTGNGIFWYNMFMLLSLVINYITCVQMHVPQTEPIGWVSRSIIYPIILSFFCWIIAEVFAIGIKLREEQELTI